MQIDINDIVICQKPESITFDDINNCLHSAYKVWRDKGVDFGVLSQDAQATKNRIEGGYCLTALYNNELVGTISYNIIGNKGIYFFMLGVDEKYKNNGIATLILEHLEKFAISNGYKYIIADTSKKADWLLKWYQNRGYNKYTLFQYSNKDYQSVSLKKYFFLPKIFQKIWCRFHYIVSVLYFTVNKR